MRTKCAISDAFVRDCVFAYCASVAQYVYSPSIEHCSRLRNNAISDERVRDCALNTHSVFSPLGKRGQENQIQGRGNRGGGGSGGNLPPQLGSCRGAPPNFGLSMSLFFFARELGSLPKNSGPNPGSFQFWVGVTLDPRRRLPPPPPTSK